VYWISQRSQKTVYAEAHDAEQEPRKNSSWSFDSESTSHGIITSSPLQILASDLGIGVSPVQSPSPTSHVAVARLAASHSAPPSAAGAKTQYVRLPQSGPHDVQMPLQSVGAEYVGGESDAQSLRESEPAGELWPLGHDLHDVLPVWSWYWPAAHLAQELCVWYDSAWYRPASQLVHSTLMYPTRLPFLKTPEFP
jgi:hypothetical protein